MYHLKREPYILSSFESCNDRQLEHELGTRRAAEAENNSEPVLTCGWWIPW